MTTIKDILRDLANDVKFYITENEDLNDDLLNEMIEDLVDEYIDVIRARFFN